MDMRYVLKPTHTHTTKKKLNRYTCFAKAKLGKNVPNQSSAADGSVAAFERRSAQRQNKTKKKRKIGEEEER
jgi:hypothetical protein